MCKDFGIIPISRVLKSLPTEILNLKYYGLTEKQVQAIMEALKTNAFVTEINFQDNWLTTKGVEAIAETIGNNHKIRYVNLRECRIKSEGAHALTPGLSNTISLKELDLSFNGLEEAGMERLAFGLEDNSSIAVLNLSHNNLGEGAAIILASVMLRNDIIEELDLSWNNFCTAKGNKAFFEALSRNSTVKSLNLAWNGIGTKEAVKPLAKYLRHATLLEHLDLSNNRLTAGPLKSIYRALTKCTALISFSIAGNPVTPAEASLLITLLKPKGILRYLNMDNVFVTKDFVPNWKRLTRMGMGIKIGGILGNYTISGPDINKLLFARAKFIAMKPKKKKAKRDFGHFILTMPEKPMTKDNFKALIKKFKMKAILKDADLFNAVCTQFPGKKGKIDVNVMRESFMTYYPDTILPEKKIKEKKGKKKGKAKGKDKMEDLATITEVTPLESQITSSGNKLQIIPSIPEVALPVPKTTSSVLKVMSSLNALSSATEVKNRVSVLFVDLPSEEPPAVGDNGENQQNNLE